jgi:hypothetical protein
VKRKKVELQGANKEINKDNHVNLEQDINGDGLSVIKSSQEEAVV